MAQPPLFFHIRDIPDSPFSQIVFRLFDNSLTFFPVLCTCACVSVCLCVCMCIRFRRVSVFKKLNKTRETRRTYARIHVAVSDITREDSSTLQHHIFIYNIYIYLYNFLHKYIYTFCSFILFIYLYIYTFFYIYIYIPMHECVLCVVYRCISSHIPLKIYSLIVINR